MTVHTQPAYQIRAATPAPAGYPRHPSPDSFSETPFLSDYEARRRAFFAHVLKNPAPANTKPAWHELARLAAGEAPHEGVFEAALDFIDARNDCADFVLHGILRLSHQFLQPAGQGHAPAPVALSPQLQARIRQTILSFKYFPDEPGRDSMCTWTENHYILFTSAACLAGQLYPGEVFTNTGETGQQKVEKNRARILRWMDLRFRTGFSEWLSHVYYDEDLAALLSLHDFAADKDIRQKAAMLIDLLAFDMALNTFRGVFGATHGRAYENTKKWASNEGTTDFAKLLFGVGVFSGFDNMSAVALALSTYRAPAVLEQIVTGCPPALESKQRMGIRLDQMETWGLRPDNFEDGMHCLTLEAYLHPRTITNTLRMFDTCNWWENRFLENFRPYRGLLKLLGVLGGLPGLARMLERDVSRNTREEVNIYTYKTPDYMLSTAQDYRPGYGGDQQHIWQATLGPDAVCFTTHPAKFEGVTPNYWAGSGLLPRAAQYRNVAVIIYNIQKIPALYVPIRHFYTHAWLPRNKFDEVLEHGDWIFARRGEGYLALRSRNPYFWREPAPESAAPPRGGMFGARDAAACSRPEDVGREILADGAQNIWLCQMGRAAEDGRFTAFVERVSSAKIVFGRLAVCYDAPGLGEISFGWQGSLRVSGAEIPLGGYGRYDNPYACAAFGAEGVAIEAGGHSLTLDWPSGLREARQGG